MAPAVNDDIVRIAFKPQFGIITSHPPIKRIVQEQIGQQRTYDSALRRPLLRGCMLPSGRATGARSHRPIYSRTHGLSVCAAVPVRPSRGPDCRKNTRHTTHRHLDGYPERVRIVRPKHPLEGQTLRRPQSPGVV